MKKLALVAAAILAASVVPAKAQGVRFGVGFGYPVPVYVAPRPVVVAAPVPVYVAPDPVVVAPVPAYMGAPVYVAPAPVCIAPPLLSVGFGWGWGWHHGHHCR